MTQGIDVRKQCKKKLCGCDIIFVLNDAQVSCTPNFRFHVQTKKTIYIFKEFRYWGAEMREGVRAGMRYHLWFKGCTCTSIIHTKFQTSNWIFWRIWIFRGHKGAPISNFSIIPCRMQVSWSYDNFKELQNRANWKVRRNYVI